MNVPYLTDPDVTLYVGDALEVLAGLPDESVDAVVTDLAAGTAGEHLVCADLLLKGFRAFRAEQVCPYDVAVDAGRLVRIQVKTTRAPRAIPQRVNHRAGYLWNIARTGKGGRRTYGIDDFDLLALVALDVRRIAYLPPGYQPRTISIRTHEDPGPTPGRGGKTGRIFSDFPFDRALRALLEGGEAPCP